MVAQNHVPNVLFTFLAENSPSFVLSADVDNAPLLEALLFNNALPDEHALAARGLLKLVIVVLVFRRILIGSLGPLNAPEHELLVALDCGWAALDHDHVGQVWRDVLVSDQANSP